MATSTSTTQVQPLPPVPTGQELLLENTKTISQNWLQWLVQLREKINLLNTNLAGWASIPINTGIMAGIYGDATHTLQVTVDTTGRLTAAQIFPLSSTGGVLPVVTGEINGSQPVFVYLEDGSLLYAPVT